VFVDGEYRDKTFKFPSSVIPRSIKKKFVSGILDITLKKATEKIKNGEKEIVQDKSSTES
jgi:HSP20 family molecular chaperone IbpA